MYLSSNAPILEDQRADAARHASESRARLLCSRKLAARGRAGSFTTLISPEQVQQTFGNGAALDAAKLQAQTETSRATGLLGSPETASTAAPTVSEVAAIIRNAPEVVSLNRGGGCQTQNVYRPVPLGPAPKPGMPPGAPAIVQTSSGPLYFRGPESTIPGAYRAEGLPVKAYAEILHTGLTGYAPPWSDAGVTDQTVAGDVGGGVTGWISDHPWLTLAAAGLGVFALSRRSKR